MSARAPKRCADCTTLVYGGGSRCPEHVRQPWANHGWDRADTAARRRMKADVFRRAGHLCQIGDTGCLGAATEVDRIDNTLGYVKENLQAACRHCHARKSSQEGNWAQGHDVPDPHAAVPTRSNAALPRQRNAAAPKTGIPRRIEIW